MVRETPTPRQVAYTYTARGGAASIVSTLNAQLTAVGSGQVCWFQVNSTPVTCVHVPSTSLTPAVCTSKIFRRHMLTTTTNDSPPRQLGYMRWLISVGRGEKREQARGGGNMNICVPVLCSRQVDRRESLRTFVHQAYVHGKPTRLLVETTDSSRRCCCPLLEHAWHQ